MRRLKRIVVIYFIVCGSIATIWTFWSVLDLPIYFDRLLIESQEPVEADYIVCVTGGLSSDLLPTEDGWRRIYASVQLYLDDYAPKIVFSGGGAERVTEAEVYAEAASWFGCPADDILFEPGASSTAEHPGRLLQLSQLKISKNTRLIIVTTPLHSRRTAGVFKKMGFTNFRLVNKYSARKSKDPIVVRSLRASRFAEFQPNGKSYDDIFNRLKRRTEYFFSSLRELAALVSYKIKGKI
jgi:uncharacterized SAM-binding protein YcdF (DUF218 family)